MTQVQLVRVMRMILEDVCLFSQVFNRITLRSYQKAAAHAIIQSVRQRQGLSFVVMFPRQSGKNELQALLEVFLLVLFSEEGAEMVKVSPTYTPQAENAMRRLEKLLKTNPITRTRWRKQNSVYQVGRAAISFLSAAPAASIVGATASLLLAVDEAQDVSIEKYDKEIAPMAASTNATRVFWGTAWTSTTLLARELRLAGLLEKEDGIRRVFMLDADDVAAEVPAYGKFVREQVAKLGRMHPKVRSQFYCEEINTDGGLFPQARQALMQGSHPPQHTPHNGQVTAFLLDVAGADESPLDSDDGTGLNRRDATALTIVAVALTAQADMLPEKPVYHVLQRMLWVNERHAALFVRLRALLDHWQPQVIVVDATGIGAGLASFLAALPGRRVIPFIFNAVTKSNLGWHFINLIDAGRFKDYACPAADDSEAALLQRLFFAQMALTRYEISADVNKRLRWGVPETARLPQTNELAHDDVLISAALCSVLDGQTWRTSAEGFVICPPDPLTEMKGY